MKKNILIVIAVLIANALAYTPVNAQMKDEVAASFTDLKTGQNTTVELIGDETVLITTDKTARIECDNDKTFMKLFKTHEQLIKRYTCTRKKDRKGPYNHYVIYLSKGDSEIIRKWSNKNL